MLTAPLDTPRAAGLAADAWSAALLASLPDPWAADAPDVAGILSAVRRRGWDGLRAQPLPSRRQEAWRFTDLGALQAVSPSLLPPDALGAASAWPSAAPGTLRLRLEEGPDALDPQSLPAGLQPMGVGEIEQALGQTLATTGCREHWPVLLNKASSGPVLALRVTGAVSTPLELVSDAGSGSGVLPLRLLLVLDPGASLELMQVHRAAGASLTSVVVEARLGAGATLHHGVVAEGGPDAVLLAHLAVAQDPESTYTLACVSSGWGLGRLEPRVVQIAGAALTRLRGLQHVGGRRIADTHSQVMFAGPEGRLDQLHKVVADGAGRSVFNGAVRVPRAAQRTDAAQLSRSLLLSDRARIDTKPQLEIVADDVKCAHGATVTRLQQEELFYLRSRGIDADTAARLLLRGYCDEVLRELPAAAALWQPLRHLLSEEAPAP
jgi:FeS assembly protein SufD